MVPMLTSCLLELATLKPIHGQTSNLGAARHAPLRIESKLGFLNKDNHASTSWLRMMTIYLRWNMGASPLGPKSGVPQSALNCTCKAEGFQRCWLALGSCPRTISDLCPALPPPKKTNKKHTKNIQKRTTTDSIRILSPEPQTHDLSCMEAAWGGRSF